MTAHCLNNLDFRPHTAADYPQIAELRWTLKTEDSADDAAAGHEDFLAQYGAHLNGRERAEDTVHWVAAQGEKLVAAMTVRRVAKEPSPGRNGGQWGYLTNCYVRPDFRNVGVGSTLLEKVKDWAEAAQYELLVVWPSDRAYPFYRRAGFSGESDPLELLFECEE